MRVFLASTGSGMSKGLRDKTVKICRPRYILETFFNGEKSCLEAMSIVGNDSYIDKYIKFIINYKIKHYFEIDVDNIFGLDRVEFWRNKMESAIGYQCIPVWHKGRGVEYWKRMCKKYSYIAIGGLVFHVKKQEYELIRRLVEYAYYRGVKVHGLGFTKTRELKNYKFYSVDSASWVVSATRGQQIHFFKNGYIKTRQLEKKGHKVDLPKLVAHNMIEWTKFQKYMDGVN